MNRTHIPIIIIVAVAAIFGLVLSVTAYQLEAQEPLPAPDPEIILNPSLILPEDQLMTLADEDYGYAYQIPADWRPGDAADQPGGRFTTYISPIPTGEVPEPSDFFISMGFGIQRASKFMPAPDVINPYIDERALATSMDIVPYLPEGELETIGDYTIHIYSERDPRAGNQVLAPYGTTIHFLVENAVYHFYISYTPPSDPNHAEAGWSRYNQVVNTIVYNFRVDKNSPYFVNRSEPIAPEIIQEQIEQLMQEPHPLPPTRTPVERYPPLN